jgi:hypothetical protein
MTAYQVYYWFPPLDSGLFEVFMYIFRWFSITGPFYVLYKIPEWGLSFLSIFGILSGLITLFVLIIALIKYKGEKHIYTFIALFFYFPYTILLNLILISGIIKYSFFTKKRFFIN